MYTFISLNLRSRICEIRNLFIRTFGCFPNLWNFVWLYQHSIIAPIFFLVNGPYKEVTNRCTVLKRRGPRQIGRLYELPRHHQLWTVRIIRRLALERKTILLATDSAITIMGPGGSLQQLANSATIIALLFIRVSINVCHCNSAIELTLVTVFFMAFSSALRIWID